MTSASKHGTLYKVVILGDGGVGKSSLMNRFVNNEFDVESFHTIGVEFLNKDVQVGDEVYTMQIWDTAGQERFKSLRTPFYRGTDCCLLTFDVNDRASFDHINSWRQEFIHYADVRDADQFPFVLLGNKVDKETREIKSEEALAWCAQHNMMPYFETSAKDNINVQKAFVTAAEQLKRTQPVLKAEYSDTVNLKQSKGPFGCC